MGVLAAAALLAAACLATSTGAVDVDFGSCPAKQVVQNFDVEKYMGKWYELERYWQVFEINGKCVTAEYTLDKATSVVGVKNTQVDSTSGDKRSIEGTAVLTNSPEAKLAVTFQIPVVGNKTSPYWVLDTDYTNYSIVYSCSQFMKAVSVESAWILSRTPSPSESILNTIKEGITKAQLKSSSFQKTTQDCESA